MPGAKACSRYKKKARWVIPPVGILGLQVGKHQWIGEFNGDTAFSQGDSKNPFQAGVALEVVIGSSCSAKVDQSPLHQHNCQFNAAQTASFLSLGTRSAWQSECRVHILGRTNRSNVHRAPSFSRADRLGSTASPLKRNGKPFRAANVHAMPKEQCAVLLLCPVVHG